MTKTNTQAPAYTVGMVGRESDAEMAARFTDSEYLPPAVPEKPRYTLHTASEALLPQTPVNWIVKNLFAEKTVSLFVGDPGSKKTWALIDLAVAVAHGEQWLNFETQPSCVLLIDEESGNTSMKRRLGAAMRGHGANGETNIFYVTLERFDLGLLEDTQAIEKLVIDTGAKLVIIDAFADVMTGDENSKEDVQPIFQALREIAERTGAAILVIHHTNKNGTYRGSSAMNGVVDVLLMAESKPDSSVIKFKSEKVRDILPVTFEAVANFESAPGEIEVHKFWLSPCTSTVNRLRLSDTQEWIVHYLVVHGPTEIDTLAESAEICSYETARKKVMELAKDRYGITKRCDAGVAGGRGKKATYTLTQKGAEYANSMR